jgi:hypothetical protein
LIGHGALPYEPKDGEQKQEARPHPGLLPQGEGEMVSAPWPNDSNGLAPVLEVKAGKAAIDGKAMNSFLSAR